jgi:ferredoxin-like protein FixX
MYKFTIQNIKYKKIKKDVEDQKLITKCPLEIYN